MHIFFVRKPLFDTPTTCKKDTSRPYTLFAILNYQKHYQTGEEQANKFLDQVLTPPWTKFWLKKGQILDQVLTLQR